MSESFAWPEGAIYLWTGTATASAIPTYAQSIQGSFERGWDNFATLSGGWRNTLTGERADVTIGTLYTVDNAALRAFDAAKADVHMHIRHDVQGASAGYLLYSGRIDRMSLGGRDDDIYQFTVDYHANVWSAYG